MLALGAAACAAPVLVLVSALCTRIGIWDAALGYDLLTRRVAFGLSFLGLVAAGAAMVLAWRRKAGWPIAGAALLIAVLTLAGFGWRNAQLGRDTVEDVSTDLVEIPGFGPLAAARGTAAPDRTVGVGACPGAVSVPTQSVPEAVVYVLQHEGVTVRRAGVTGVYGSREGFWFGFTDDVAVRIRPRRTDIRVAARDGRPHGGAACRLASRIAERLQAGVG